MGSASGLSDRRLTVWNTMLDADMNLCYWTLKCNRSVRWDQGLKTLVALTASGTAIAALSVWARYPIVWQVISVVACVASVIHSVYFPSEKLTRISGLVATWKELSIDYELLWQKYDQLSSSEAWKEFEATKRRERTIDESQFPVDNKLREKAVQHVLRKRGLA